MRNVDGYQIPMRAEEARDRDAEEAEWAASAPKRAAEQAERESGLSRLQRDLVIAALPAEHPKRIRAEQIEAAFAEAGVRGADAVASADLGGKA